MSEQHFPNRFFKDVFVRLFSNRQVENTPDILRRLCQGDCIEDKLADRFLQVLHGREFHKTFDLISDLFLTAFCGNHPFRSQVYQKVGFADANRQRIMRNGPAVFLQGANKSVMVDVFRGHDFRLLLNYTIARQEDYTQPPFTGT